MASGTEVAVLGGHTSTTRRGTISPDGRLAATVSIEGSARLWDAHTGELIEVLGKETGVDGDDVGINWTNQDMNAAFSPDGSLLATASLDGLVRIWNVGDGSEFGVLRGHNGPVEQVAFSPDGGRLLTASHDGTARLWEINAITVLRHERPPFFAAFSADGTRLVTVSRIARTAHVWDMVRSRTHQRLGRIQLLPEAPP